MEGSAKPYYLKNRQYKKLYEKQTLSIKIWLLETMFTPTFLAILRSIDVINKFLNKKRFQLLLYIFLRLISQFQFFRERVPQRYNSLEKAVFQLLTIGKTMIC